jgi:hypothetical protein
MSLHRYRAEWREAVKLALRRPVLLRLILDSPWTRELSAAEQRYHRCVAVFIQVMCNPIEYDYTRHEQSPI